VWDVLKIEIRDHTIMYCKNKSKLNRQERRSLEKELNLLFSICLSIKWLIKV
jgi:hypothetical protein